MLKENGNIARQPIHHRVVDADCMAVSLGAVLHVVVCGIANFRACVGMCCSVTKGLQSR